MVKLTAPKTSPVLAVPSKTIAEELLDADEVVRRCVHSMHRISLLLCGVLGRADFIVPKADYILVHTISGVRCSGRFVDQKV